MRGTLLIIFYLARDTVYRWISRISSPLSRLCVVFFLSLCGLIFLSSYVISIKLLKSQIRSSGADLIIATEFVDRGKVHRAGRSLIPPAPEKYQLFHFNESFSSAILGRQHYSLVEYMPNCSKLFPHTQHNGMFLLPAKPVRQAAPEVLEVENFNLSAVTLPENRAGLLRRLFQSGAVFIPYGSMVDIWKQGYVHRTVMRIKTPSASNVQKQENLLRQLARLDKLNLNVISSGKLLTELGQLESSQYKFRVWVTIGISAIICLLLTSISSLEFRQNRYVYALIGSFGISRGLLFTSFIVENTLLVAVGFGSALATVWAVREYITSVLYKSPDITLSLWELENDIRTFCLAFGICVLVSSIPIGVAACRPIGKVLK